MNLIILFESDFVNGSLEHARLKGRRRDHVLSLGKASIGSTLYVGLINGKMGTGIVRHCSEDSVDLDVSLITAPPAPLPLILVLSLPRPRNFLKCIETAVILGIKKLYIIQSYLVEKDYWGSHYLESEIIRHHVLMGLEQARDTIFPSIQFKRLFKPFVEDELRKIAEETKGMVAHPYCINPCPFNVQKPITLAIGPEGGFIPYEVGLFKEIGFEEVTLGPRILRVEQTITAIASRLF